MSAHLLTLCACVLLALPAEAELQVGCGIADMTGQAAEEVLYGYGSPSQDARGIHLRTFARAFVFLDTETDKRVAFVVCEITMSTQALRTEVTDLLAEEFGDLYTDENVMISTTHTHSAPGGQHAYWMYAVPNGGFSNETFDAYAAGIVTSIRQAHEALQPAQVFAGSGELLNASISRSPYSYDQNPQEERDRYPYNIDNNMTVLRIEAGGNPVGMISFFPVHTTSMKRFNHLVSSDNKGYAAQLFERYYDPEALPGQSSVIGAFAQAAEGDVTPNVRGDFCDDTCDPCSYNTSTCPENPDNPALCNSYGHTGEIFQDTQISGWLQFEAAREIFESADEEILGTIDFRHVFVNMSAVVITDENGEVSLCRPSMGYSFAAGATDGPGAFPFTQGDTEGIPRIDDILDNVINASDELVACQAPKPILLPTGEIEQPSPWQPEIIPIQLFRIGNYYIAGGPGEYTTMSGRRITESIEEVLKSNGASADTVVLFSGVTNEYSSYITTPEEYSVQRYEGGSTIYGPNTLNGHIQIFTDLALALITGDPVQPGPDPPRLQDQLGPALGPIVTDEPPEGTTYGDVVEDVMPVYVQGDVVSAIFVAGNPRNDLKTGSTFLEVQQEVGTDWQVRYTDAHWETRFYWDSTCHDAGLVEPSCRFQQSSNATITWYTTTDDVAGNYRLVHYGNAMTPEGEVVEYTGTSGTFQLTEN